MKKIFLPCKTWQWEFVLPIAERDIYKVLKDNQIVAEANYNGGIFSCSFLFEYSEIPYTLSARQRVGIC